MCPVGQNGRTLEEAGLLRMLGDAEPHPCWLHACRDAWHSVSSLPQQEAQAQYCQLVCTICPDLLNRGVSPVLFVFSRSCTISPCKHIGYLLLDKTWHAAYACR